MIVIMLGRYGYGHVLNSFRRPSFSQAIDRCASRSLAGRYPSLEHGNGASGPARIRRWGHCAGDVLKTFDNRVREMPTACLWPNATAAVDQTCGTLCCSLENPCEDSNLAPVSRMIDHLRAATEQKSLRQCDPRSDRDESRCRRHRDL